VKILAILTGGLLAVATAGADSTSIYHEGWIDLNKNGKLDVYENPTLPIEKRVNDLLKRMTIDEKIGQLWQTHMDKDADVTMAQTIRNGGVGSFLDGSTVIETPILRNKLQHIAIEQSRLGIPLILGHDAIHGFRTVFPIPLAQACAWEPELFERTQTIAAREASAAGIDWTFAPMVDLARDPRWGRIAEGFGEDPYLGSLDAIASVKGFQGPSVAGPEQVVACVKHYAGYGAAEGGRDYNTTEISPFTLRNFYLPQFKAAIDAGALTVMSAFNDLDGIPASGNPFTLTEVLRKEWNFPGFVVSDYNSVVELIDHGLAADDEEAARIALTAGVDMEMMSTTYVETVKAQIDEKKISKETLDNAVRHVLTVKFAKGLFDRPYTDEARYKIAYLNPDAVALAREAAAKSCVLLKNDNGILPLSKHVKIVLIGPLGSDGEEMVGPWYSRAHAEECVSLATGIQQKLSYGSELNVSRGCAIFEMGKSRVHVGDYSPISEHPTGTNEIAEAVEAAKNADVVVMALGEPRDWSGEDGSRSSLDLPGRQQELLDAIAATGKPIVVVLFNGRPLALPNVFSNATAVLEAWFPGIQGGNGVADLLFGDIDPSGRLTTTFPYSVGQVPMYYNHDNTGRPGIGGHWHGNYVDGPSVPFLPFGFGLGYTTFHYGEVQLGSPTLTTNEMLTASVDVTNTGKRPGIEVAQLYIRGLAFAGGTRPVRELKGFQRILLQPGQTQTVSFTLAPNSLGFYDAQGHWIVQPGKFQLWICQDSASGAPATFELEK
jgi:beta-glucosidase